MIKEVLLFSAFLMFTCRSVRRLASLCVMEEMAGLMEQPEEQQRYAALLARAKEAYVAKLWNGRLLLQ